MRNSFAPQLPAAAAAANNNNMLSNRKNNGVKKAKNKLCPANSKRIEDQASNLESAAANSDNLVNLLEDHESPTLSNSHSDILNKNESSAKKKIGIEVSHVSRNLPQSSSSSETHEWTVSLKPLPKFKEIFGASIKRVVFNLHSSFAQPARSFSKPPFELTEKGWGSFYLRVDVIFKDSSHHSLNYDLQLNNFAEKSLKKTRRYFMKIEDFSFKSNIDKKSPEISLESQKSDSSRLMNPQQNNSKDSLQNNTQNRSDENIKRFNSVFGQSLLNCHSQLSKRNRATSNRQQSVQKASNKSQIVPENLPKKESATNLLINKCEEGGGENYGAKKACLIAIESANCEVQKNSYCGASSDEGGSSSTNSALSSKPNNNNETNEINFGCRDETNICGNGGGSSSNQRLEQIQSQIMRNNNCQMLKTIVECVNHSGNLQKTNISYTFDLCKLDSDTIVKIQNILGAS